MDNTCAVTEDNSHGGYTCQYNEHKHYTHDNKSFCKFHLPFSSEIKSELSYENDLIELINGGESMFLYFKLLNVKICLSSTTIKESISFRHSILDGVEFSDCKNKDVYINFFECKINKNLIFKDLTIRKIRFDKCLISHKIKPDYINILKLTYEKAIYFENITLNEMIFENYTKVENNVFLLDGCKINHLIISDNTRIGIEMDFYFNIFTKFSIRSQVKTLKLSNCSLFMLFEVQNIHRIRDLIFDNVLLYQAPCIRGVKEFTGKIALPNIGNIILDTNSIGLTKSSNQDEILTYWYRNFDNYNRLNKLARENNLLESESDFYVLSRKCFELSKKDSDMVSKALNLIYDYSSSYGTKPAQVLFWYLFTLLIPSVIYQFDNIKSPLTEGLYSMTRLFNFNLIKCDKISILSKIISVSQTISGVILTTALAISLKWYFRKR